MAEKKDMVYLDLEIVKQASGVGNKVYAILMSLFQENDNRPILVCQALHDKIMRLSGVDKYNVYTSAMKELVMLEVIEARGLNLVYTGVIFNVK
jgi:hypothetical protein